MFVTHVETLPIEFADTQPMDAVDLNAALPQLMAKVHRALEHQPSGRRLLEFYADVDEVAGTVTYGCEISLIAHRRTGETAVP